MKSEIELARSRVERTGELAAAARYAREQLVVYQARADGPKVTSPAQLRELQHAAELAEVRLQRAQRAPAAEPFVQDEPEEEAGFRGETDDGVQFR